MKRVYLDYAAATPVDARVMKVMQPFFSDNFANASAIYTEGLAAKAALEEARASVAQIIGARPSEIIFTAGGTESDNLAVQGIMNLYSNCELIISAVEHDAMYEPSQKFNSKSLSVSDKGIVDVEKLDKLINDNTVLISVMLVNSEIGTIQPVADIVAAADKVRRDRLDRKVKTPLYVHTDAAQAPLYLDVNVARLGVDLMTLNGGKIYGPKHSGILYAKAGTHLEALILGGGQELGYRSGTENVAFAVGFAEALRLSGKDKSGRAKTMSELRDYCIDELESRFDCVINGHKKRRIANNVHVSFPGHDNERILFSLDEQGIAAATGSACSASKDEPSRVLRAIGLSDETAQSSLRFSFGKTTTRKSIDYLLDCLEVALKA